MTAVADRSGAGAPLRGHPTRASRLRAAYRGRFAPQWWRDLAGSLTWASLLVVTSLWVTHGGVQACSTPEGALTSVGRLSGLWAADLLMIQVVLMARVPFIERSYGQDELAKRHRWVGFASFNLLLVHLLTIVLGYALTAGTNPLAEAWSMVVTFPGMLMATLGTAMLTLVVITSIRLARASMRYESWHLIHLYAYVGIVLSIPHELWSGSDFITSPWAKAYWWGMYGLSLAAVLIYRIGLPVVRTLRHGLRVSAVVQEGPGVVSVYMTGRQLSRLPARAGQFFIWRFLDGPGWTSGHAYSLSEAPMGDRLRITVKNLGDSSSRLARMRPGTKVLIEGPYGRLTTEVRTRRKVTFLASGIGITPLRALVEEFDYQPGEATVIFRASTPQDMILARELDQLAQRRGARVFYVAGPRIRNRPSWLPANAANWRDDLALRQLVPDIHTHDVYLCGADEWMHAAKDACRDAGVPDERLHAEHFSW